VCEEYEYLIESKDQRIILYVLEAGDNVQSLTIKSDLPSHHLAVVWQQALTEALPNLRVRLQ
jgi:hypothetical protein